MAITPVWDFIETWDFRLDNAYDFPISPHKKWPNQTSRNPLKMTSFRIFLFITPVWDLIETWGFRVYDISISPHKKFTKPNITQPLKNCDFYSFWAITPVWDFIETWGFCVADPGDPTSRNLLKFLIFCSFLQ